jgi:hypothetical protein
VETVQVALIAAGALLLMVGVLLNLLEIPVRVSALVLVLVLLLVLQVLWVL